MAAIIEILQVRNGVPDNRELFDEGNALCSVRCVLNDGTWVITYYVAADERILLLSVFLPDDLGSLSEALRDARNAMGRCIEHGDNIDKV